MSYPSIEDMTWERWEHAGFVCRIVVDDMPHGTPREDGDPPSTLVTSSRLHTGIGDETFDPDYLERTVDCPHCEGAGDVPTGWWSVGIHAEAKQLRRFKSETKAQAYLETLPDLASGRYYIEPIHEDCPVCDNGTLYLPTLADALRAEIGNGCVLIPLRYEDYGSSGSRLYEGEDDDFNAYVYVDHETVMREWGGAVARMAEGEQLESKVGGYVDPTDGEFRPAAWWARSYLLGEVEEMDEYLQGNVYGWMVGTEEEPHMDSCWGFYGLGSGEGANRDHMHSEANGSAEHLRDSAIEEANEAAEWAARGVVTV